MQPLVPLVFHNLPSIPPSLKRNDFCNNTGRVYRHVFHDWMVKEGGISLLDKFFRLQVKCHSDS